MALEELQREVDEWITNYTPGYFSPLMMLARLTEELGELSRSVSHHHGEKRPKPGEDLGDVSEEIGDLLFVVVNIARFLKVDPEQALRKTNTKFRRRFSHVEEGLAAHGKTPQQASIDEMEALWQAAKHSEV